MHIETFGLDKNLVSVSISKTDDLVLNRWAISRPDPLDLTAVESRTTEPSTNDVVGPFVGFGNMAADLPGMIDGFGQKGETGHWIIARLRLQNGKVDRPAIDSRRSTRLQACATRTQFPQAIGKNGRRRISRAAAGFTAMANMDPTVEKSTGS